jgi:hypothetical protein
VRDPTKAHVGAVVIACPEPLRGLVLHLLDRREHVLIQPFALDRPVVAFDIGVMLRVALLDVLDCNATIFGPSQQLPAALFRAVVDPDSLT